MNSLALTRHQAEQISNDLVDRYRQLQISWVSLMNDIQKAIDQGVPAALGYSNYKNWLNIYFGQSASHLLRQLKMFRLLKNIDEEKLESMPEGNRYELSRLSEKGLVTPLVIDDAANLLPREFKEKYILTRRTGGPRADRFGDRIGFRGLVRAPVNEMGVVFLFGMVAGELGYDVEAVHAAFPDCDAKENVSPGRWKSVRIEFEFESRNYRTHGHNLESRDVIIVCWRHNWPNCPPHLKVIELSREIEHLPR
jgi:hypothetical protein